MSARQRQTPSNPAMDATATRREGLAAAAREHLAAAMAHEARNRLNPINIHVDLLRARLLDLQTGKKEAGAQAQRSLDVLRGEVERLDAILSQYLQHAGPAEAATAPTAVRALLEAAVERGRLLSRRRGVRLEPEVSLAGEAGVWPLDEAAISLALDALLRNAIEASAPGGAVTLRAHRDGELGSIEVTDAGEGLAAAELKAAFQLGWSTRPGHAGLGLAIAKQAIRNHPGAQLVLRSDGPGRGAIAEITLPFDEEDEPSRA